MMDDECGVVGGMIIDRGNQSTRGNPALVQHYPPQIPHDLTWGSNPGHRGQGTSYYHGTLRGVYQLLRTNVGVVPESG
jgi:hypothetical protein